MPHSKSVHIGCFCCYVGEWLSSKTGHMRCIVRVALSTMLSCCNLRCGYAFPEVFSLRDMEDVGNGQEKTKAFIQAVEEARSHSENAWDSSGAIFPPMRR